MRIADFEVRRTGPSLRGAGHNPRPHNPRPRPPDYGPAGTRAESSCAYLTPARKPCASSPGLIPADIHKPHVYAKLL